MIITKASLKAERYQPRVGLELSQDSIALVSLSPVTGINIFVIKGVNIAVFNKAL